MLDFRELFTICGDTTQRGHDLARKKWTLRGRTGRRTSPEGLLADTRYAAAQYGGLAL